MLFRKCWNASCLLLFMLVVAGYANAKFIYTVETFSDDVSSHKEHLNVDQAFDGVDPITNHILFSTPGAGTGQVLWQTTANDVTWDLINDAFVSPNERFGMVVDAKLPDDAEIQYTVISSDTEREVRSFRHTRAVAPWSVDALEIDQLDPGHYMLQAEVVYVDESGVRETVSTFAQSLWVVAELEEGVDFDDMEGVVPGDGWSRPLRIDGSNEEPAIAHWNVVPKQTVQDGFTVGVIAYHLDGIDRVEIAVNGGEPVVIREMSLNPRTGCEEYWAPLDTSGADEELKLRATVYCNNGHATPVMPQGRVSKKEDLTLYLTPKGEVLELPAGRHELDARDLPETGWLTVRPAPGVARDDCVLVGGTKNWSDGRLKLENLTIELPAGGSGLRGKWSKKIVNQHLWLDGCKIIGNGPKDQTWWTAFMWETVSYTDCEITKVQNAFHSAHNLIRNCYVHNIYEDTFRGEGLFVNVTIENVDREPMVDAQRLSGYKVPHPDIWQCQKLENTIAQDITAVQNINAQGFFPRHARNVALVGVQLKTVDPYSAMQMMGKARNVLIKDSAFDGSVHLRSDKGFSVEHGCRLVFEGAVNGDGEVLHPTGFELPGIEIRP